MVLRALALSLVLTITPTSSAIVFFEVTPVGEAPDGLESVVPAGHAGQFDVWLWADTENPQLFNVLFDVGGTPDDPASQWEATSLGALDPDMHGTASEFNLEGTLVDGVIDGVRFIEHPFLTLPQSVGEAVRLYGGFAATSLTPSGVLTVRIENIVSTLGGPTNTQIIDTVAAPPQCAADLDGDDDVDVFDFSALAANFGSTVPAGTGGDLDADTDVDVFDFGLFAADFGCPD